MDNVVIAPGQYSVELSDGRIVFRSRPSDPRAPWSRIKDYCQRDERWRNQPYSSSGSASFGKYGCLVTALTSLATFAGYDVTPLTLAREIDKAGAFEGNFLRHPSKVADVFPRLKWHYDYFVGGKLTSLVNWRNRPADMGILATLLQTQPVVVEVDFDGADSDVDQHFVLALAYRPDPLSGVDDELLILDPFTGRRSNVLVDYFNPKWMRNNTMKPGQTRVSRTVMGLRLWQVVFDTRNEPLPDPSPDGPADPEPEEPPQRAPQRVAQSPQMGPYLRPGVPLPWSSGGVSVPQPPPRPAATDPDGGEPAGEAAESAPASD
ncbi:MAG: hypothetical protein E3J64_00230 [Anaerolineales bacterium]|nr:MAG: hypothetical protein E3J64_00230 [Anaerolineales bacterium]